MLYVITFIQYDQRKCEKSLHSSNRITEPTHHILFMYSLIGLVLLPSFHNEFRVQLANCGFLCELVSPGEATASSPQRQSDTSEEHFQNKTLMGVSDRLRGYKLMRTQTERTYLSYTVNLYVLLFTCVSVIIRVRCDVAHLFSLSTCIVY